MFLQSLIVFICFNLFLQRSDTLGMKGEAISAPSGQRPGEIEEAQTFC